MKMYFPNKQIPDQSIKQTSSIGIIASHLREPLVADILETLFENSDKLGVNVYLHFHSDKVQDISLTINSLLSLEVDTIIIFSSFYKIDVKELEKVRSTGKRILLINPHLNYADNAHIKFDFSSTYESIIKEIVYTKEKYIAMLAGNNGIDIGANQLVQLTNILDSYEIDEDKRFLINTDINKNNLPDLLQNIIATDKSGIVIVSNKELLGEFLRLVYSKEWKEILQHIKIIVLQFYNEVQYLDLSILGINYPIEEIVDFIFNFHLSEELNHNKNKMVVVPTLSLSEY